MQAQLCHTHNFSPFARPPNGPSSNFLCTSWSAVPPKLNEAFQSALQTLNTGDKNSPWGTASSTAQCLIYLICDSGTFKALAQFNIIHGLICTKCSIWIEDLPMRFSKSENTHKVPLASWPRMWMKTLTVPASAVFPGAPCLLRTNCKAPLTFQQLAFNPSKIPLA